MTEVVKDVESVGQMAITRSLLDLGACLYECQDTGSALDAILSQARAFSHAEAGSIYLAQGECLKLVAVQNDKLGPTEAFERLLGKDLAVNSESLAGFVASLGQPVNVTDSGSLSAEAPFRINHDLAATAGYAIRSILAIPLNCPDGGCIGVMELFNRLDPRGEPGPFPETIGEGVISLAYQAAMALHSLRLREQLRQAHLHSIFRLSAIAEYRDTDTGDHIQRVSRVSELLAEALGLDDDEVELIKYASPMHDVGKVGIPDAILLKPGHLTPQQRAVMQRHTVIGAEIFGEPENEMLLKAQEVALHHHERWDGQGYPNGLEGKAIPISGRIVGLADVFDAIVSKRCYKEACSLDVALDIIEKDSGHHFDPRVAEAFLAILDSVLEVYPALATA